LKTGRQKHAMNKPIAEILNENHRRNGLLDATYDPLRGIGSPLKRTRVWFPDVDMELFLPDSMLDDEITSVLVKFGTFKKAAANLKISVGKLFKLFIQERFKHDFEFWAAMTVIILNKDTFKPVRFILRGAQRELLYELEDMRLRGVPIRIVLLKARQWGGSTLVQIYMMWIQQIHRENWHAAVCAQVDDAAKNISNMYDTAAEHYPKVFGKITFKPYKGSSKNRMSVERKGIIGVGSYLNPDQFRSYNYAMAHLSEVGLWKDTEKIKAMNLVASLKETVPDQPYTLIVEESTAKGLNYFHDSWKLAVSGKSRYKAVFIPWWKIDRCRTPLDITEEEFIKTFDDYHWYLWELGATLEGINWYRLHKADKGYQDWEMMSENPSTPEEAFQSSGQKVFPPNYILAVRRHCMPPKLIGDVFGDARLGKEALNKIRIEAVRQGNLKVWKTPEEIKANTLPIRYRFCGFADIGGISRNADYSGFKLIDREPMMYGADPEVVLDWHGHLDQDLFAWKCAQLCMAYANTEINEFPLLAFEIQSLKKKGVEGNHSLTVLDELKDDYPNIYTRNDQEKVGDEWIPKYGFHTNTKTKGLIINALRGAMREIYRAETGEQDDWGYIEYDSNACDEFSWYEVKENGELGNIDGKHDDRVMYTAGAVWLATKHMDLPMLIDTMRQPKRNTRNTSYAKF